MISKALRFLTLTSTLGLMFACSSTTTVNNNGPGGGGTGSQPAPTADCKSRCQTKATSCQASASEAQSVCGGICDGTFTNDQLACLEGKSCSDLQNSDVGVLCPKPAGSNDGGSSGSSGGSSSTTKFSCSLNGTCYKCADADALEKCTLKTGAGTCTATDASYCEQ